MTAARRRQTGLAWKDGSKTEDHPELCNWGVGAWTCRKSSLRLPWASLAAVQVADVLHMGAFFL